VEALVTVRRVDHGRYHSYIDADTGLKIPGVTTIVGDGVPKPALIAWAANTTAEYALDHWERLGELAPSARLKELKGARYAEKDAAARKGTQVHKLAQRLVAGEEVAVPDELAGHVAAYVRFLDEFDVEPVLVEAVIVSNEHRYCGTLDLVGDLLDVDDPSGGRVRWLLDVKTTRSGVYGETALQLAGYRYADAYLDDDGDEQDMPAVDRCGVVWVRPDGYDLVPVEVGPAQHRQLLYAQQTKEFVDSGRDLIGEPIIPPTTSTYRLVKP
jgi:hypothetical protein